MYSELLAILSSCKRSVTEDTPLRRYLLLADGPQLYFALMFLVVGVSGAANVLWAGVGFTIAACIYPYSFWGWFLAMVLTTIVA